MYEEQHSLMEIPRKIDYNLKYQLSDFDFANKYDLDSTMKNFEKEDRIIKYKKDFIKPIKKQNKIWKRNLERCLEIKEENRENLIKSIVNKMKSKEKKTKDVLKAYKSERSKEKEKRLEVLRQSQEKIYENLNRFYKKMEEDRLETEVKVYEQLRKRSLRQAENIQRIKHKFEKKNKSSEKRFEMIHKKLLDERKRKEKEDEEKKFDNFSNWYFFFQGVRSQRKKIKSKQDQTRERAQELQKELDEKHEHQRLETENNLKLAEKKRLKQQSERKHFLMKKIEEDKIKFEKTKVNREFLVENNRQFAKDVMKLQTNRILESYQKDKSMALSKCNQQ